MNRLPSATLSTRPKSIMVPPADKRLMVLLKFCMVVGIFLIIIGHLVLAVTFANEGIGHRGYILGAALSAVGIVLSLPTKIYLTILLMEHEQKSRDAKM